MEIVTATRGCGTVADDDCKIGGMMGREMGKRAALKARRKRWGQDPAQWQQPASGPSLQDISWMKAAHCCTRHSTGNRVDSVAFGKRNRGCGRMWQDVAGCGILAQCRSCSCSVRLAPGLSCPRPPPPPLGLLGVKPRRTESRVRTASESRSQREQGVGAVRSQ